MATNTSATSQNHNGTGSQANFAISFPFLLNSEIEVTVGGVLKTLGNHYNIVGSEVQFTSDNIPASGTANVVFNRDTNISTKRVDFEDGSVLTEADLDNNVNQVLFAQQELSNDYVKRDGSQTVTGNLVFEGSADDANETTLAITNPTADRTITVPDRSGTIITSGDTGTVTNTMLAGNSVDSSKIIDGSIVNADVNASAAIAQSKLNIANATTSAAGYQSAADKTKLDGIEPNATQDQTSSDIKTLLASDPLTATHLAANSVDSSELVDGSVDHSHLSNDCVDGDNVQDNSIDNEHIAANAVRVNEIKDGEITSAKLNPSTVITSSEQGSATTNDTSFLTSAAADARFFNISSGDTIKDGQTFPDNDTTIATTAAINDRIIDLIDDVGGFTIIASEQAFPDVNPQGVTGQAAVLSIKAATTNLVPSGTTVTVVNGNVADNANITITGVPSTIPSGFGFLVESTTTLHTYSFHRLVPKATEVTTVAGKAVEIGRLGTADAVADMAILGTTDVVADMNTLATADIVSDMNTLATTDVVNDMNTLAVTSVINNMDTVASNVTNVNNVGNNITNVNNLTNSTGANQTFTVTVQNVSGNKYFIDGVQTPVLKLARGKTYTFNLADSSNSGHPLAFRDSSDNAYTTGVTTSGTAGSSGATVVIVVAANAPNSLKYYCTSHGNAMGNTINVIDDNVGAVAGALTNVGLVGGSITNVNNVGNSISNVNTVANNLSSVNSFANTYRIGSTNPTTSLDTGDLFFNTSTNSLKVYTGSAWVDGVTQTGNFALKTGNTFTGDNIYNDNVKVKFGTGSDLEIFHNGSASYIQNTGTTGLNIHSNNFLKLRSTTQEDYVVCTKDGSVELYYDDSKKFETTSGGATVFGNLELSSTYPSLVLTDTNHNSDYRITNNDGQFIIYDSTNAAHRLNINADGNIQIPADNKKLQLGASQDLEIFHDGGISRIVSPSHALFINTTVFLIKNAAFTEDMLAATSNGSVDLYYDNSKKLETTSSGVTVTGTVAATSYTGDGSNLTGINTDLVSDTSPQLGGTLDTNGNMIRFGDAGGVNSNRLKFGAGNDLHIYHNGTNSTIREEGDGDLLLHTNNGSAIKLTSGSNENMIVANQDGAVELYHNNSKKFETNADGVVVNGVTVSTGNIQINNDTAKIRLGASQDLQLYHDGTNSYIENSTGDLILKAAFPTIQGANGETIINAGQNGAVNLYYDNSKKFETSSTGVIVNGKAVVGGNIEINQDAYLKIGASNDLQLYHVSGNSEIYNASGNLRIRAANNLQLETHDNEMHIKAVEDGQVELYYDNSKKFQTATTGGQIFGDSNQSYLEFKTSDGTLRGGIYAYSNNSIAFLNQAGSYALQVLTDKTTLFYNHALPQSNNSFDLGSTSNRWRNIYTNDLNLSNEGGANDVDGTWGSYTIQEGAEDLFLVNKRNGKKYKFNLTEVS